MMGTIRFKRFFDMVTSKNVSWRVRGLETRSVGTATAVFISAILSRNGKDARSQGVWKDLSRCSVEKEWKRTS